MISIEISGEQGSGKTRGARAIHEALVAQNIAHRVYEMRTVRYRKPFARDFTEETIRAVDQDSYVFDPPNAPVVIEGEQFNMDKDELMANA